MVPTIFRSKEFPVSLDLGFSLPNWNQKFAQSDLYNITYRELNFKTLTSTCFEQLHFLKLKEHISYGKKNTPLSYTRVRSYILEYMKSIGLDENSFGTHSLRRGGATSAANNGVKDINYSRNMVVGNQSVQGWLC